MEVKNERFRERIDEANNLISIFMPEEKTRRRHRNKMDDPKLDEKKQIAKRIRRYIYTQSERPRSTFQYACTLDKRFPVLESLSPELQRSASLMGAQRYLEKIPYLSSRFLSSDEQSLVARQCIILEFPVGEVFRMDQGVDGFGRGILVQANGLAWRSSQLKGLMSIVSRGVIGDGRVLLEDGHPGTKGVVHCLSFSLVAFIPRQAILSALARNPTAWMECARWKYLGACLVAKATRSRDEAQERTAQMPLQENN